MALRIPGPPGPSLVRGTALLAESVAPPPPRPRRSIWRLGRRSGAYSSSRPSPDRRPAWDGRRPASHRSSRPDHGCPLDVDRLQSPHHPALSCGGRSSRPPPGRGRPAPRGAPRGLRPPRAPPAARAARVAARRSSQRRQRRPHVQAGAPRHQCPPARRKILARSAGAPAAAYCGGRVLLVGIDEPDQLVRHRLALSAPSAGS